MNLEQSISKKLAIKEEQVKAAVTLIDDGNTIPFIARYRKEVTGGLLDEQLEQILEWTARLRVLEERREAIFKSLKEQEIKDTHLLAEVRDAETMTELEDLYTPYRPKRKTRASVAKEKGLEGLAKALLEQSPAIKRDLIKSFFNAQVLDEGEAIAGAKDIAAEVISDTLRVRSQVRSTLMSKGGVESTRVKDAPDENGTYTNYYEFRADISKIRPHQLLAIHRAEQEKVLRYKLALPVEDWKRVVLQTIRPNPKSVFYLELLDAIEDAGERLLMPALEREIKSTLLEQAEDHAIEVFTKNLRNLLLQPPLKGNVVLGLDPGFRTGCKIAVTDPTGRVLAVETIYPHEPRKDLVGAYRRLTDLIKQHGVRLISLGNGTASKESEKLVAEVIKQFNDVKYIVTNEAGASVYSASALARKEFPNLDVSLRSAVSIA
ncbi:MAG TPA: Tex-like N-terminal domain-containing protein, partial [Anaerolineaceae bacterium]